MRTDLSSISKISRMFVGALVWLTAVFAPPEPAVAQDVSARFLADYGNVTVMEVTGNFDQNTPEGSPNAAPRQAIAKEFFRTHKDEYDFITIFTNFDVAMRPDAIAFYNHIKNDVRGIGQQIYDNSALYGSNGKLQGTIDMGNLLKLTTTPLDPHYDITVDTMMHETLHRWSAFVKFRDWNGGTSDALLGSDKAHWSFLFDSGGSTLYGNKWRDNGNGTFTSTAVRKYYSPQDLYLMGMLDKSKVPPTLLIDNPAIDPTQPSDLGATISGIARTVTVDDIIAVEGERSPSFKDSQKQFKTAFIYVVTPGSFNPDDLIGIENLRNGYLARFSILTDGQGVVQVASTPLDNLPANPGVHPPATMPRTLPPNINDGLNWLVNHQQADGSWTDFALTTERDTAESVATLQLFPTAQSQFRSGLDWLGANGSTTTDYLARRIEARVHAGADSTSLVQELLTRRNSDGGWGGGRNFISSPTDTAQALKALAAASYGDQTVTGQAIAYLQAAQNLDGGWSGETISSIIQPTAAVLSAYATYRKSHDLEIGISKAVAYLTSKQNSDGGFGNSPSTVYDSSLALMALQSLNADKARINNGMNYLLGQQAEDGSWNESPLQTALSMRAVWQASVEPDLSIKAEDITIIPGTITALPTNAVLSATIQNLGNTDVPQAKISLYEGSIDPEHKLADQTLAFPGQSSVTVTFPLPVTSAIGHVYYVAVDPDNLIKETNKGNNRASKSLLPEITYDFQVLNSDISAMPNSVDAGKDVKIAFKMSNRGTSDAYNVPVRLFIDQAGAPVEISQLPVDIPAGGSVAKEVIWKAGLAGVNLTLTVQIDPNNTFRETSKDNNKASVMLTVNASTLPNLSVSYKDMIVSPSPAREGGSASISVLVKNDGFSNVENIKVSFYKGVANQGGVLLGSQTVPGISIGQSLPVSIIWTGIDVRGEQIFSVLVESENPLNEITKNDNFAFTTVKVLSLPDLVISGGSIIASPTVATSGAPIKIAVTVQNSGEQEARDVAVRISESGTIVSEATIPLINGNSQTSITLPYTASALTGMHELTVVIDPENHIPEQKKDNNSAIKKISVQDSNLMLSEPYFSPNGDGVKDSTDFTFRLSAPANVKILVQDSKGIVVRTFSGGSLESTVGTTITWDGKNDLEAVVDDGEYQFKLIDSSNIVLMGMKVVVDTNRSPLSEALGTRYLQVEADIFLQNVPFWSWLPDEGGIVYSCNNQMDNLECQGGSGLYLQSSPSGEVVKLTPAGWDGTVPTISISPNSDKIAFVFHSNPGSTVSVNGTWLVDTNGIALVHVDENEAGTMRWTPDGGYLMYSYVSPSTNLARVALVNGNGTKIFDSAQIVSEQSWSPDGERLAFLDYDDTGATTLKTIDLQGRVATIVNDPAYIREYYWLDARRMVYAADSGVYIVDIQNTGAVKQVFFPASIGAEYFGDKSLFVSPSRESFLINLTTSARDRSYLYRSDRDGNVALLYDDVSISPDYGIEFVTPAWSKDGRKVAVAAYRCNFSDDTGSCNYRKVSGTEVSFVVIDPQTGENSAYNLFDDTGAPYSFLELNNISWLSDNSSLVGTDWINSVFVFSLSTEEVLTYGGGQDLDIDQHVVSPFGRFLFYQDSLNYNPIPTFMSSLLNLTADLKIAKYKSMLTLKGIASDKHLAEYRLEYADVKNPDVWNLITPPTDIPVLNSDFTTWVPPYEGGFFVKLTVSDKAGNVSAVRKRVNWGLTASITNLYKTNDFISPNGDGSNDNVELRYRVLEPINLEFQVFDDTDNLVRTFHKEYVSAIEDAITWDGRNEAGGIVPDGKYRISVLDYDIFVEVDATQPKAAISLSPIKLMGDNGNAYYASERKTSAFDKNAKKWDLEVGEGENPLVWTKIESGGGPLPLTDTNSGSTPKPEVGYREELTDIPLLKNKRYRITSEDYAGNKTTAVSSLVEEVVAITYFDTVLAGDIHPNATNIIPFSKVGTGKHHISGFETIHQTTAKTVLQYYKNNAWIDIHSDQNVIQGRIDFDFDPNSFGLGKVFSVRVKVVDIYGKEHISNIMTTGEEFRLEANCAEHNVLYGYSGQFEPFDILRFTLQSTQDPAYAQPVVLREFSLIKGDQTAGNFTVIHPELKNGNTYVASMVGITKEGKQRTITRNLPESCSLIIKLDIRYKQADGCDKLAPGNVTLNAQIFPRGSEMLKSLDFYIQKPDGWHSLATLSLTNPPPHFVTLDTSQWDVGDYPVKAVVSYLDTIKNVPQQMVATDTVSVDRTLPAAQLSSPHPDDVVCPMNVNGGFGVKSEAVATDNSKIGKYDLFYATKEKPDNWINAETRVADGTLHYISVVGEELKGSLPLWDVSNLKGRDFSLMLQVFDKVGNLSCGTTSFSINSPVKVSSLSTNSVFSPNGDGVVDNILADYQLNGDATVSATVSKGATQIRDLLSNVQPINGKDSLVWDGKADDGSYVQEADYRISIYATDICNNVTSKAFIVSADTTPPVVSISYPRPGDQLPQYNIIGIVGTATDLNFKSYLVEVGEGDSPSIWKVVSSGNIPGENKTLADWNTYGYQGRWTLRLTAYDVAGNSNVVLSIIDLGLRKDLIKDFSLSSSVFSPNKDNQLDSITVAYEVTDASQLRVDITDSNGSAVLKSFYGSTNAAGKGTFVWDGKDIYGNKVADGNYTVRFTATLISQSWVTQVEELNLVCDTSPPVVDISSFQDQGFFNRTDMPINGKINDPNLASYSVTQASSAGTVVVDSGTQPRNAYLFGTLASLAEDTYAVTILAKDLGENQTALTRTFTIDRTPPKVTLDMPKSGEYYGNSKNEINVAGSIIEKNLERYLVRYGLGESPAAWNTVLSGTTPPPSSQLLGLKVGKNDGIADGLYTLSLYAVDKVGLESEVKTKIVVDNNPPEVSLSLPKDGEYVTGATSINGTVYDANFDTAALQLASGSCETAVNWGDLKTFTTSLRNTILEYWKVLPSDGEYCLRLMATDKVGNKVGQKVGIKIDTQPPAPPQLAAKTENKVDNQLSWSRNVETDLAGYNVYRNGKRINSSLKSDGISYSDLNLNDGTYVYTVKAVDFAGNESGPSNSVTLKIDLIGPKVRIASPSNEARVSNMVDIMGSAYSPDDFKEYRVYIGQGNNQESLNLLRRSPLSISYGTLAQADSFTLQEGSQATIRLEAEDLSGNVSSSQIKVTIDNSPPKAPELLTVTKNVADVTINWKASPDTDVLGYLVYRNIQLANASGIVTGNLKPYLVTGTTYTDKSLPDGIYSYYLVAVDGAGNISPNSNNIEISIDLHPPHMTIAAPTDGKKFDGVLMIKAETPDNDIASVQFQYKRPQDAAWGDLGVSQLKPPFIAGFDSKSLSLEYGDYQIQVLAVDKSGNPDPNPPSITVTYADVTPPAVPSALAVKVTAADVALTWSANTESDLDGYNVYRSQNGVKEKINGTLLKTPTHQNIGLSDGNYSYAVTSVDAAGNESKPSQDVFARIYVPSLNQPFSPVAKDTLRLEGDNATIQGHVDIMIDAAAGREVRASGGADANGHFLVEAVPLYQGENRLSARVTDLDGNISRTSEAIVVYYKVPPQIPTGLVATPNGFDVPLVWTANPEENLAGYNIYRDGIRLNVATKVEGAQASASSSSSNPQFALDGTSTSSWLPYYGDGRFVPVWWQMDLAAPELVSRLEVEWHSEQMSGKDFEVQAWSGYAWITLAKVLGNTLLNTTFSINPAYRTDRIRLNVTATNDESFDHWAGLREVVLFKENPVAMTEYQDLSLKDGTYLYKVSAVDSYGFESALSEPVPAIVGDVTPPAVPFSLSATANGSNVLLDWSQSINSESDFAGYRVYRTSASEWQRISASLVTSKTYVDPDLPNGTYRYRVSAVDNLGNESAPSPEASGTIDSALPVPPDSLQVTTVSTGKSLVIAWQPSLVPTSGYNLYRSAGETGHFDKITASPLFSLTYTDIGLMNGTRYTYVVTALDSLGNESAPSKSVSAIPADSVAPLAPIIFQPTRTGVPMHVMTTVVTVGGIAEPASVVDIFDNGSRIAKTSALSDDIVSSQTFEQPLSWAATSPDGTTVAYIDNNNYNVWIKNVASGENRQLSQKESGNLVWAPDSQRLAYNYWDAVSQNVRIGIYDLKTGNDSQLTNDQNSSEDMPAWSPDGTSILFTSSRSGSQDLWLKDLNSNVMKQVTSGGDVYWASFSPAGNQISYVQAGSFYLQNLAESNPIAIGVNPYGGSESWSPDGKMLAFITLHENPDSSVLHVINTDTAAEIHTVESPLDLVINLLTWAPGGKGIVYSAYDYTTGTIALWYDDFAGGERLIQDNLNWLTNLELTASGSLEYFDDSLLYKRTLAGTFAATVVLNAGENVITARSTDEANNAGMMSDPITVIADTGTLPDLVISESGITLFPPIPKPGEEVLLTARVNNPTGNIVDNVTVDLYLWDGSGEVVLLKSESIPHLGANGEESIAVRFNAGSAVGSRTVIAVVDPSDTIQERLETNNYASKDLVVTDQERVQLTATLNALTYASNQELSANIALLNSGMATNGILIITVEDTAGGVVKQLAGQSLDLSYGLNVSLPFVWNTGATFAGNYRLHALLVNGATTLAEDVSLFTMLPDLTVTAGVATDRQQYGANQNVGITASFMNTAQNYLIPQLKANVRVFDAQNTQLFAGEQLASNILPGMSGTLQFTWNSGLNAPGNYTAKVEYSTGDQLVKNASMVFNIAPLVSVTGSLKLSTNVVSSGDDITVSYTLVNNGNSAAAGQAQFALVDPDTLSVIASSEQQVSIPMGGTQPGTAVFATSKLLLKPYLLTLAYVSQGNRTPVGTTSVSVKDTVPPLLTAVSPMSGQSFSNDVIFLVLASDNASGVERIEYSRDGGTWNLLPPVDQAAGRYGFTWTPVAAESGTHTVSFRGTDRGGNTSSPLVVSFVILAADVIPPVLKVSTLTDGSFTKNPVLNIDGSVSDDRGVKEVSINGTAVSLNADGSFSYALQLVSGANQVEVKGSDLAGNISTDVRTINLDLKAPFLIITSPSDNSKVGTALMEITGSVDETSSVVVKLGGIAQSNMMNGNDFTSSVSLVPGPNTIEVTATDQANNSSSEKRTVIYDDQKPSLAITDPKQDIRTNQANITLKGTVSDPYTAVKIAIFMDGQTYTPLVTNGNFEQQLMFTQEKNYAIVVTATNEAEAVTMVQRNVIYDISAPDVRIDGVVSPTSLTSQVISGGMEEGAKIVVSCTTATVGDVEYPSATTWRTTLSGFTAADNSVVVTASDTALNSGVATTTIVYDTTPPTGSITINDGAPVTGAGQVILSLAARDANGISQMRFSNDGNVWSDPEKYATTRGWFLAPGDGFKQVFASYQDVAGNWSVEPIVAKIVLDATVPTVTAAPAGGVYKEARSVTLIASEPAVIRYTVDGTTPTSSSALYQEPIQIASDTTLRFMASDSVGNRGNFKPEVYVIDTIPPSLTVSTLPDGSYTSNQVLNIAGTATDSSGIASLTINGVNVAQNQDGSFSYALVLQPGANAVTVAATDLAGNSSTDNRMINLDTSSPLLTVETPSDNAKTATALIDVTGVVDETSTVMVTLGTSVQQAAMTGSGFSAPVSLIPGINTIGITATDLAGNSSTQKRTVVYDDRKPSLAVSDPSQDIRTNQSGLILRGTVSDPYTLVSVTVTIDGQSYTPPVSGGAFEQQLSFTQEKSYAIVVTATNEAGSSVTTQRNVIYDITPPALAINAVESPTTANSVLISGTRETDVAVAITCSTATVGTIVYPTATSWQVQLNAMALGEHIVTAQASDAANNVSTVSTGIIVQQSGADIVLTPSPAIIWPPNHKMVPVSIVGLLNVPLADIKSLKISLSDEYGKYNFTNLKLGSTVLLEAWRNGNDPDGRKYTFSAVLTRKNGNKSTATAVVVVPHDMNDKDRDEDGYPGRDKLDCYSGENEEHHDEK